MKICKELRECKGSPEIVAFIKKGVDDFSSEELAGQFAYDFATYELMDLPSSSNNKTRFVLFAQGWLVFLLNWGVTFNLLKACYYASKLYKSDNEDLPHEELAFVHYH